MAYILEKFSTWTNPEYVRLSDGGLEKYAHCPGLNLVANFILKGRHLRKFTKDELLTIIMIYWTNGNIVSSQRYYKELFMTDAAV